MPVRILSRPTTPAYGVAGPRITSPDVAAQRVARPREELAQHAARLRATAGPRSRTALGGVAIVLVITFVGLFYLSQIFEAAAARYEVQQLTVERQAMLQELQTQQGATLALSNESTVSQWAQDKGLAQLRQPLRLPAP